MKSAMIGDRIKAEVVFEIDKIERENGIVAVSGTVELENKKKRWVSLPLECCQEVSNV